MEEESIVVVGDQLFGSVGVKGLGQGKAWFDAPHTMILIAKKQVGIIRKKAEFAVFRLWKDLRLCCRNKRAMPQRDDSLRRAIRLFKIVTLVLSNPPGTPLGRDELSFSCGCGIQTIHRDVKDLRSVGVPLEYDAPTRSYRLPDKEWVLPLVPLTSQDALAVALARSLLAVPGIPQRSALAAILDKITAGLPPALRALLAEAATAVRPAALARDYSQAPLNELIQAAAVRQTVEIDYASASGGTRTWRCLDPYAIEPRDGQFWELHAWDHRHDEIRTFALDRIVSLRLTGQQFIVNAAAWAVFAGATGAIGGLRGGRREEVEVRFAGPVAAYALARRWPDGLTCTAAPDGTAHLTGAVQGLDGITAELLRWRRHAQVLGGPALRARMGEELRAMLLLYDEPSETAP